MKHTAPRINFQFEILSACADHINWKRAILDPGNASEDSASEPHIETHCKLGTWLDNIEPSQRSIDHYETVRSLHRSFHIEVSGFLSVGDMHNDCAERQRAEEVSRQLVDALNRWIASLEPNESSIAFQSVYVLR